MESKELLEKIRGKKLVPIRVEEEKHGLTFQGSLDELLDTAVALGERAIFVAFSLFNQEDLSYFPGRLSHETEEDPEPEIDLTTREPQLAKYREQFGKPCAFTVFFSHSGVRVSVSQQEEWYRKYLELRDATTSALELEYETKRAERAKKAQENLSQMTTEINTLADDAEFRALPNKDLMRQHILKKFPKASELPRRDLENLLSSLYANAKRKR